MDDWAWLKLAVARFLVWKGGGRGGEGSIIHVIILTLGDPGLWLGKSGYGDIRRSMSQ